MLKKRLSAIIAGGLVLALAGFAPLGWAQDATMTDTESGSYTEGDATAVALTFAVSGEVPQFLLNLIPFVDEVEGAASGQVSYVQAPAAGMGEGSGLAWTGGTTSASRTLPEGDVVYSYTEGGTNASARGTPIGMLDDDDDTAYAVGVLVSGGAVFDLTILQHPVLGSGIGALSASATSTRMGTAGAGSYGDAAATFQVLGKETAEFAGVKDTATRVSSFSTNPETYAASLGFVAAAALSVEIGSEETGSDLDLGFSGINSLGVVRTRNFVRENFISNDPGFDGVMGGFVSSASGESLTSFNVGDMDYLTQAVGDTEAFGKIEVEPRFFSFGTTSITRVRIDGELWAHAGKNALAVGFSGVNLEGVDHPVIPEFYATLSLVDAVVYARDYDVDRPANGFMATAGARFYNPALAPDDDDDDPNGNGEWTDYDPLAVISQNGSPLSYAAIGAGMDGPAEGTAELAWRPTDGGRRTWSNAEMAVTGAGGLSASAYFPKGLNFNIGPFQGALQEVSTTDFGAFSYVRFTEDAAGPSDIMLSSELTGLYGLATTPSTRTELLNGSAFSSLFTLPFAQIGAGSANELLSGSAVGPGAFSFAASGNLIQFPFGAGFGLSIGVLPAQP